MLVLVKHLIRAGRYDRTRVTTLGRLLARFEAQPGPRRVGPQARAQAKRVAALKRELSDALGGVRACAGCAEGCVTPSGYFDGGRCCGTSTLEVFTQGEVRAMKLAGIDPPTEPAETGAAEAGCLFRGATGCSLSPEARPARCLVYVCGELRVELDDTDRAERIHALRRELHDAFAALERETEPA
jgi:hypothetical protein